MRISNQQLIRLATDWEAEPAFAALAGYEVITAIALDLRDARAENITLKARIAELELLSASQSEAMDMMDRGAL